MMHVLQPDPKTLLNRVLSSCLNGRSVSVLEAGGGSRTHLREQMLNIASVTTVDISAEQLARNTYADFKIEADLEKFEPERSYDVVIMFQVLEHLQNADRALENLARACADDGFVVVGSPYMRSFSGMVTRFTPHWFHVFFYRRILGWKTAGQPGYPPFRAFYHPLTLPQNLQRFFEARGFETVYLGLYQGGLYRSARKQRPLFGLLLMAVTALINIATPKSYNSRQGEYNAVFRKAAGDAR
jgi:SAM-dependent methyltransferase